MHMLHGFNDVINNLLVNFIVHMQIINYMKTRWFNNQGVFVLEAYTKIKPVKY